MVESCGLIGRELRGCLLFMSLERKGYYKRRALRGFRSISSVVLLRLLWACLGVGKSDGRLKGMVFMVERTFG